MGTGNRMFAEVRKNDLGHSIEVLGPKPSLKSQNVISAIPSRFFNQKGGSKHLPYAFTEQGVYTQKGIE